MTFQSIPINTIKLIPINNQKTGVNSSFLMLNRIAINTKILIPTNIQKKVVSVIIETYLHRFVWLLLYQKFVFALEYMRQ